jgi:hypothetical protein
VLTAKELAAERLLIEASQKDLRRFAVSTSIETGFQRKAIHTLAGHSRLEVTMDGYSHLFRLEHHERAMGEGVQELSE